MPKQFNLNECGDCRFFEPLNKSQLCEQGSCYLNKDKPCAKERADCCEKFSPIEGEFDE